MIERPNFLFFITDQLRADHLGSYGNRTIRTPTVDSLAAQMAASGYTLRGLMKSVVTSDAFLKK